MIYKNIYPVKASERSVYSDGDKFPSTSSIASSSNMSVQSWADRVRGGTNSDRQDSVSSLSLLGKSTKSKWLFSTWKSLTLFITDEDDGWEVVKRGRRSCGGSSASLNSQTPPNSAKGQPEKVNFNNVNPSKGQSFFHRNYRNNFSKY